MGVELLPGHEVAQLQLRALFHQCVQHVAKPAAALVRRHVAGEAPEVAHRLEVYAPYGRDVLLCKLHYLAYPVQVDPGDDDGHQQDGQPRLLAVFYGPQLYVQHVPRAYLAVDGVVQAVKLQIYEVAASVLECLRVARHVCELYPVGVHLQVHHAHSLAQPDYLRQVLAHRRLTARELHAAEGVGFERRSVHIPYPVNVRLELLRVRIRKAHGAVHVAAVGYLQYTRAGAAFVLIAEPAVVGAAALLRLPPVLRRGVYALLHPALVHVRVPPEQHAEVPVLGTALEHIRLPVYALIARGYLL